MSGHTPRRALVLAGPMGAGKTTCGRLVAGWLGWPFEDLDELIERATGKSVPELFERGEEAFRKAERAAVRAWLEQGGEGPRVLALGGGTLEDPELREVLARAAAIVHLDAPGGVLASRLDRKARARRPLLAGVADAAARLDELRRARAAGYSVAAARVDTGNLDAAGAAVAVLRALYDPDAGPWAESPRPVLPEAPEVTFGRGGLPFSFDGGAAVLVDAGLPAVHAEAVLPRLRARTRGPLHEIRMPGGEESKSPGALARCWSELLAARAERGTAFVVVGGGTLTDLGGLAAHTFKRGLPLFLLPTTLLGQVDAALGGKNGINLAGVKNVVGTVRLPRAVHIDPLFVLTLAEEDYRGGLAEALKSSLIGDRELFDLIEARRQALAERRLFAVEEVAVRAAAVKLRVVARDLDERDERRRLNFGHTLGHALESAAARAGVRLSHGDAVAAGMVAALRLSRELGFLAAPDLERRVQDLLAALGLPVAPPPELLERMGEIAGALAQDKKRSAGRQVWVLLRDAGDALCAEVGAGDVRRLLESVR
ncbi:MAG: hypothetical protein D6718_01850 [Acidobacteria bacterium]|nr:MAG: hypothetical protein D6718_01850 [Acidobacteriota bacterium]